ncbi:MAG: hypothetical protein RIQ93_504, partial [Verrucomicrobiota bacterium]
MSAPVYLDLSHTSHTRARTGIQRVTRSLRAALGGNAVSITHDSYLGAWRELEPWEGYNLSAEATTAKRGALWPVTAKLRGRVKRWWNGHPATPGSALRGNAVGVIVPEVFSPAVAAALPALFAAAGGPRIAVFHDAIPLKLPELSASRTVARFPTYLQELLVFDGIAAVSDDSRDSLLDYWRWLDLEATPPVRTISLGIDVPALDSPLSAMALRPTVLSVGSIEGRKNHLALLEACEQL